MSLIPSSAGFTSINLLNVNALYIQGVLFDSALDAGLQAQIDAINTELVGINAVVDKFDVNGLPNPQLCVITTATTNQALKTLIDNINTQIGSLNKLDLSALPAVPAGACIITTATTNQALKALIDGHDANIAKFDLTAMPAAPPASIIITPTTTNQALKILIDNINTSITAINLKLAHFSTFSYGADVMSGIADGTGFACAVSSGSASGNGIFVYPNASSVNEQIQIVTALDKNLLLRGGNQVGIFGGTDSSLVNRNLIDIGDKLDRINIGRNHNVGEYPEVNIGVDSGVGGSASTTNVQGDIYYSGYSFYVPGTTPCLVAETTNPAKLGNTNNYSSDLTLTGLDVIAPAGVAPITFNVGVGNILTTCLAGTITSTALAGGIFLNTGAGVMALSCGAGGFSLSTGAGALSMNTGAGLMNLATSSANIEMSTLSGNITLGAGKAAGGSAGITTLNAKTKVVIQPDATTEIYKTDFIEFTEHTAPDPSTIANRLYQQNNSLYFDGVQLGSGSVSSVVAGTNISVNSATASAPIVSLAAPLTSTLNMGQTSITDSAGSIGTANQVLTCTSSGGKTLWANDSSPNYVLKAGDTMTGALNVNYSQASGTTSQINVVNTNATGNGGQLRLQNQKTGAGAVLDNCGTLTFAAKNSSSATNVTYSTLSGKIADASAGTHDGILSASVASQGTITETMRLWSNSTGNLFSQFNGKTAIGSAAIGSTPAENLRVTGTTAITTSLDVPVIINALNIYPSTSTATQDEAIRQYQPERVYKLDNYPSASGITAPTIDGEKIFILNKTGSPSGSLDMIWDASSFPGYAGATFSQVIKAVYVNSTSVTPACIFIATLYSNNTCYVFLQADVPGVPLTMVEVCNVDNGANPVGILDMVITFPNTQPSTVQRLYFGGGFANININGSISAANNWSGQILITWNNPATTFVASLGDAMTSIGCALDASFFTPAQIGVNDIITTIVCQTGNSNYPQPSFEQDSIVIGGNFTSIPGGSRPLEHIAWYDYSNAGGQDVTWINESLVGVGQHAWNISYILCDAINLPTTDNYTFEVTKVFLGTPTVSGDAATWELWKNNNGSPNLIHSIGFTIPEFLPGGYLTEMSVTFPSLNLTASVGLTDYYYFQVSSVDLGYNGFGLGNVPDNHTNTIVVKTLATVLGPIGWRTFANADWATPVGPTTNIRGGALFANGSMGFVQNGDTINITPPHSTLISNYYFNLNYDVSTGLATFATLAGDAAALDTAQATFAAPNCISGGNPTHPFGSAVTTATAYGEIYINRWYNNGGVDGGISFRYTSGDPYVIAMCLTITTAGISLQQLFPVNQYEKTWSVWRDDAIFPTQLFISQADQSGVYSTTTVTGSWAQGVAPVYTAISAIGGGNLASIGFGGYSDEVGYKGLVIYTDPEGFLYKAGDPGELVIELTNCCVRTAGDNGSAVVALNKLTFPSNADGTSIMLMGDTSTNNPEGKASWWAVGQDGIVIYDNTSINSRGSGGGGTITSITAAGYGLTAVTTAGACVITGLGVSQVQAGAAISVTNVGSQVFEIANTGVTSIVAGTNVTISGATGAVTINAASTATTGYMKMQALSVSLNNFVDGNSHAVNSIPNLSQVSTYQGGIAVGNWDLGGTGSQLRWTGANPIMFTMTLTQDINTYDIQTASPSYINLITDPQNELYVYSNFGYEIGVYNGNGAVSYSPIVAPYISGASNISYGYSSALGGGQYQATTTYTGFLKQNDWIYVQHTTNPTFNRSDGIGAGSYQAFFLNSSWTLTMHECPANF